MPVAERYLRLGLQLGRHVARVVDGYFGPPELEAEVQAAPAVEPRRLVDAADELAGDLGEGWLRDQVLGLRTFAAVLAGDSMSYADEAAGCYGVRPTRTDEAAFGAAHERLDELLTGRATLAERYRAWERTLAIPEARLEEILREAIVTCRRFAGGLVHLPEGESIVIETACGVPWMAFCKYLGGLKSRVSVNTDRTLSAIEVLTIATHEAYPGHHTERACKEQLLVRDQGLLEETIVLGPTPQSLIAEGIAKVATTLQLSGEAGDALETLIQEAGVDLDLKLAISIQEERERCNAAVVNAALMLDTGQLNEAEAAAYLQRWALVTPEIATRLVRYLTDATSRTYVITYVAGRAVCEKYIATNADGFSHLLTQQQRVCDLAGASILSG